MKEWRAPLWLDAAVVQDHDDWTVTLRRTGLRTAGLMYSDRAERTSDRTADDWDGDPIGQTVVGAIESGREPWEKLERLLGFCT